MNGKYGKNAASKATKKIPIMSVSIINLFNLSHVKAGLLVELSVVMLKTVALVSKSSNSSKKASSKEFAFMMFCDCCRDEFCCKSKFCCKGEFCCKDEFCCKNELCEASVATELLDADKLFCTIGLLNELI